MTIIALVLAALILIFFEVILPGGLLGIVAVVCILAASWLGYAEFGIMGGAGVFLGSVAAAGVLIFFEFKLMANSSFGKGFFLKTEVTGHSNEAPGEETIIGKEGTTLTRLNPSGKVAIEGQSYEAYSQDGYIDSEEAITVVSQDNFKLIIKKL